MSKQQLDISKYSLQGFSHKEIQTKFGQQLSYIDDWTIAVKNKAGEDVFHYYSVYFNPTPDRSKNHKNYFMIRPKQNIGDILTGKMSNEVIITGLDREDIMKSSNYLAIFCLPKNQVIVSRYNHDFQVSPTNSNVYVDGANICPRYSFSEDGDNDHQLGRFNFITQQFQANTPY